MVLQKSGMSATGCKGLADTAGIKYEALFHARRSHPKLLLSEVDI